MKLTLIEIDLLLEAVDAWEKRHTTNGFMGDMLGAMLTPKDPEAQSLMLATREKERREREEATRNDREMAILLKAKLIQMRRELASEQPDYAARTRIEA